MWVNKLLFQHILDDNRRLTGDVRALLALMNAVQGENTILKQQKAKDDITIDWFRHRVNALEKERAILLNKTAGILLPVPEIVPTRPGTMTPLAEFNQMPSFEDVGDQEAARLGILHDDGGKVEYTKPFEIPKDAPVQEIPVSGN